MINLFLKNWELKKFVQDSNKGVGVVMRILITLLLGVSNAFAGYIEDVSSAVQSKQFDRAVSIVRGPAEKGDAEAQHVLAYLFQHGIGIPKDVTESLKWATLSANQGYVNAQRFMGSIYQKGSGVPVNYPEAIKWFKLASAQNDIDSQVTLGSLYFNGEGVQKDYVEALTWYKLAADKRSYLAQMNLGTMYFNGLGVPKNDTEAFKWVLLSAEQNLPQAQASVGYMYLNGLGAPQDYREAFKWFKLAATMNERSAQGNLGLMYAVGKGVSKDDAESAKWYKLAAGQKEILPSSYLVSNSAFVCSALMESKTKATTSMALSMLKEMLLVTIKSYSGASYKHGTFTGSSSVGPIFGTYTQYDNSWLTAHYSTGLEAALSGSASIAEINKEIDRLNCDK